MDVNKPNFEESIERSSVGDDVVQPRVGSLFHDAGQLDHDSGQSRWLLKWP